MMRVLMFLALVACASGLAAQGQPLLFQFDDSQTAALAEHQTAPQPLADQQATAFDVTALLGGGLLNLPDGQLYRLEAMEVRDDGDGTLVWRGHLYDGERRQGSATFTISGQRAAGLFAVGPRRFELVSLSPGLHLLQERDPRHEPPAHHPSGPLRPKGVDGERSLHEVMQKPLGMEAEEKSDGQDPVIDVLVLYTPDAVSYYSGVGGGEPSLRLAIRNALEATNTAYINSESTHRVRLVAQQLFNFNETDDMRDDLRTLTNSGAAQNLRDAYAADLVALIGDHSDTGVCGMAWIKTGLGGSWSDSGYSVTRAFCLGNQTFAHELGHNMGLAHDPSNTDLEPHQLIQEWAYGHRVPGEFRTIMAYGTGCSSCPQIDHFSNPDVLTENGIATGLVDERDNVRVMAYTAEDIAAYREPVATLGEALNASGLDWRTGGGATWLAQEVVTRDDAPVPASGPLFGGESSWIETSLPEPSQVSFDWMTNLDGDFDVALELHVDGVLVDSYFGPAGEWSGTELSAEGFSPTLRWSVRAPEGSGFDNIGRAYLANVSLVDGDAFTGVLYNSLGQGVEDVTVVVEPQAGGEYSGSSNRDGQFGFSVPTATVQAGDVIAFQGPGVVTEERPAEECLGGGGACDQLISGVDRQISGTVSGLFAGESVSLLLFYRVGDDDPVVAENIEVTANAQGVAPFSFDADSVVRYWRIQADVNGYTNRRLTPADGFVVREGNLDDVSLVLEAQAPRILNAATGNVGEDFFEATADIETQGRDQTIRLEYGQDSFGSVVTQNISGNPDEAVPVSFNVSGLSCGSGYQWRMVATSDHGAERTSATRNAQTSACPSGSGGGSSSGCSLAGPDSRLDPLLPLLMILALAGLMARRRLA
ncbi:zinc-dependent metalloprotease family protein [Natronospira bacteriovora]|uniref:Zinc-dependent metalloprotease family protein n=1 Tax=Natronospira bacteriovora TaxID=3069753 RepID=A0ABU0W841_9GAMM|nr:zinc-dependent metalloprotease family protein [Natronospira sp. AB-CW4]MDQ2070088.1 zinc-dependent metalloprotease family protein [Natronospira sp. AB-CW4]